VKTTIEIPNPIFRKAKSLAASQGLTLKQFFTGALEEKLQRTDKAFSSTEPAWKRLAGGLAHLKDENALILKRIEEECERIDPEDWK